jgi:hypothetical protein
LASKPKITKTSNFEGLRIQLIQIKISGIKDFVVNRTLIQVEFYNYRKAKKKGFINFSGRKHE